MSRNPPRRLSSGPRTPYLFVVCEQCNDRFSSNDDKNMHVKLSHGGRSPPIRCNGCARGFVSMAFFQRHLPCPLGGSAVRRNQLSANNRKRPSTRNLPEPEEKTNESTEPNSSQSKRSRTDSSATISFKVPISQRIDPTETVSYMASTSSQTLPQTDLGKKEISFCGKCCRLFVTTSSYEEHLAKCSTPFRQIQERDDAPRLIPSPPVIFPPSASTISDAGDKDDQIFDNCNIENVPYEPFMAALTSPPLISPPIAPPPLLSASSMTAEDLDTLMDNTDNTANDANDYTMPEKFDFFQNDNIEIVNYPETTADDSSIPAEAQVDELLDNQEYDDDILQQLLAKAEVVQFDASEDYTKNNVDVITSNEAIETKENETNSDTEQTGSTEAITESANTLAIASDSSSMFPSSSTGESSALMTSIHIIYNCRFCVTSPFIAHSHEAIQRHMANYHKLERTRKRFYTKQCSQCMSVFTKSHCVHLSICRPLQVEIKSEFQDIIT